jgi:hypothetical protein
MWTILDLFPEEFLIHILDIGAALSEVPPVSYTHLTLPTKA